MSPTSTPKVPQTSDRLGQLITKGRSGYFPKLVGDNREILKQAERYFNCRQHIHVFVVYPSNNEMRKPKVEIESIEIPSIVDTESD